MSDWIEQLRREVAATSCAAVGRRLGYSRVAISHIVHGRYQARTDRIRAKFLEAYGEGHHCPHLKHPISPSACAEHRTSPMPTNSPARFRHWTACQHCNFNPNRKGKTDA